MRQKWSEKGSFGRAARCGLLCAAWLVMATACGDDSGSPADAVDSSDAIDATDAATSDGDANGDANGDAAAVDVGPPPPAPSGTQILFDLEMARASAREGDFFAFPYPSDARLDADGTLSVRGLPNPRNLALYSNVIGGAEQERGSPTVPVAWFRFDGPVAEASLDEVVEATSGAALMLIDIDPASPLRGEQVPVVALRMTADDYTPANVLALAPLPGWVLEPATRYAFVVTRAFGDESGEPLGVPAALWGLAHGDDAHPLAPLYAPLWETLAELEIPSSSVAAATVFTTSDVVGDLFAMSEQVRSRHAAEIAAVRVDPDDGADHPRFCELLATATVPNFRPGTPPYDTGGMFEFDDEGAPVRQGELEIPLVITLPLAEMPDDGFPLVMYFHGSGGVSSQVVDRGPTPGVSGEGPAHVLAAHGLAAASAALPLNPERLPGASPFAYLNLANLAAFRDTFRQGVIEQRLLLDALLELEISPTDVSPCTGLSLPTGASTYRFASSPVMAMGQSMGGMYTNMVAAVEPRIGAVVPTGAGGFWSYFILQTNLIPGVGGLLATLLQTDELSMVHPVLHILQTAWEAAEPLVYVPRLASSPLEGHPARPIYEPVGQGDSYFPPNVYDVIALAYRNEQAGAVVWPEMQDRLAYRALNGVLTYPVTENRLSVDGRAYTGVIVQFPGDGRTDPHEIFQYNSDVKHQYGCFFETFLRTGVATVPAPAPLGTPCVQP